MRLVEFKKHGKIKTCLIENHEIIEINSTMIQSLNISDIDELELLNTYKFDEVEIKAPIIPSKIVCVGLNYKDHANELNMIIPEEPIIFIKPSTAVIGHLNNIIYPKSSTQVDYEAELGIVIGKKVCNVKSEYASEYIGGYTIVNDVTARDKQRKDIQWTRAKSFDTFAPIGPCIETEMDPMNQKISLKLNNKLKQNSNTKNMIFDVYELIELISNIMTLNPGDIISTGTLPGVGPMNIGDIIETTVEDIGILKNFLIYQKN
ncbi:MAG: fumarylacetoacetate hydrolase family protein [Methanobacterium sp.]|nr:fumarylacetoacetate hydrolase family protein [Methanobacterium sp.]